LSSKRYLLGIDVGTTNCKCIVVDLEGRLLGEGTSSYATLSPHPLWAEQDPESVFAGVVEAVTKAVITSRVPPEEILALSFAGALHSLLAVDQDGVPLTNALIWADTRSVHCSLTIREEHDAHQVYQRTGCPVHPMYPASKIVWIRENAESEYRKTYKWISLKEYVLHKLLNRYVVDRSIASGTGLFNIHNLDWEHDTLRIIGISPDMLSEHVGTTTVFEGIEKSCAEAMGIPPSALIVVGAGDGLLSNLGAGSVKPGQLTCMIGTSGALRVVSDKPKLDEKERTWCYLLTDHAWVVGGAINNAGLVYQWFRERFHPAAEWTYAALDEEAARVGVGAEGLIFLPYLTGERSPNWNPNARGVLFGLSLRHDRRHFVRAIMEGVAYRMYSVLLALEEVTGEVRELRGSGGFLRSPLWIQIMADVCGRELVVPQVIETTSLGAVFLAMYALGHVRDLDAARQYVSIKTSYSPNMHNHRLYMRLFDIYQDVYQGVVDQFPRICEIQADSIQDPANSC
jgi:gluconokinase